jgi:hypothetical protein
MTRTLASDANNDIILDRLGNVSIVSGLAAVAANCKTAIQAQRGEMIYAANKGMPTLATAWNRYNPVQFEAAARTILRAVPDVLGVDNFVVSRVGERLVYTATIRTTFGGTVVNG